MSERGWLTPTSVAFGVSAGTAAAQLGLATSLQALVWTASTGRSAEDAWSASLAWTVVMVALATVAGAVVAAREPGETGGRWDGPLGRAGIALGATLGAVAGGLLADRWGRTTLTMTAMTISGSCALLVGFLFGGNPMLLVLLCLVWGVTIVADSAQFSASIAELSDRALVGTMLTVQTSMGFLLTLLTIQLIPMLVDLVSWRYAFAFLAIGPVVGVIAMGRLRAHPDAVKLANGRK